jgi:hypothetical protein
MGNTEGNTNNQQKVETPSEINAFRENIKDMIRKRCYQVAVNNTVSYDRYNDILSIFEDYGIINLRKSPISKKMYDKLDYTRQNSVPIDKMINHLFEIVNMNNETAIYCKIKRFFFFTE